MKVLIAEDNEKNRKLIHVILQTSKHEIIEAEDGNQCIRLAKENIPDLILLDIQMPVMDGVETLRILKSDQLTKDIPVIALTSYAMKGDRESLLGEGFDGYISKPIGTKELLKVVDEINQR